MQKLIVVDITFPPTDTTTAPTAWQGVQAWKRRNSPAERPAWLIGIETLNEYAGSELKMIGVASPYLIEWWYWDRTKAEIDAGILAYTAVSLSKGVEWALQMVSVVRACVKPSLTSIRQRLLA
jgi:hypothetical protein